MLENINEMGVFGTVLLMLALSTVWYSLPFFKRAQEKSITVSTVKELVLQMLGYTLLVWLLALLQLHALRFSLSLVWIGTLAVVFIGTLLFLLTYKEKKGYRYYLMHLGFIAIFIVGTLTVLHYWPW
jgi:hypothetical protein